MDEDDGQFEVIVCFVLELLRPVVVSPIVVKLMIGLVGPRVVCVSVGALLLGPVVVYCPGQLANADGLSSLMKVPSEQVALESI